MKTIQPTLAVRNLISDLTQACLDRSFADPYLRLNSAEVTAIITWILLKPLRLSKSREALAKAISNHLSGRRYELNPNRFMYHFQCCLSVADWLLQHSVRVVLVANQPQTIK